MVESFMLELHERRNPNKSCFYSGRNSSSVVRSEEIRKGRTRDAVGQRPERRPVEEEERLAHFL